jgi:hypothetical protein
MTKGNMTVELPVNVSVFAMPTQGLASPLTAMVKT